MVKIVWTDLAIDDLKSIHDYISRDSKIYADRFIEKIISKVDHIGIIRIHHSARILKEI